MEKMYIGFSFNCTYFVSTIMRILALRFHFVGGLNPGVGPLEMLQILSPIFLPACPKIRSL
jgi:hypothetical protein